MKKLIAIIGISAVVASCNSNSNSTDTKSQPIMSSDSGVKSTSADSTTSTMKSMIIDGTMAMKNGRMQVMTDGKWAPMEKEFTCTDGCKVMPDGHVIMKNGDKMLLKEGEMVEKNGSMLNSQGNMMMNAQNNMGDSMHK